MTAPARRYRKPEALAEISTRGDAVIEASAGTGKTHTLAHLVVELLLVRKIPIDQILAVTFTEKAARELTDRVRKKLESLLEGDWEDAPAQVPDEHCWILGEESRRLLEDALFSFDLANISTIHSFCQRVLTDHAFSHRRLFEQVQIPPLSAFGDAFDRAVREEFPRDPRLQPWLKIWLERPNAVQPVKALKELLLECYKKRCEFQPALPADLDAALEAFHEGKEKYAENGAAVGLESVIAQLFLPAVAARVERAKKLEGEYDFDDMLWFVAESLEGSRGEELAAILRRRYRCALIDEFQDTDVVQWRIFRKIFFESRGANPIFLIGDPKQAIYGFRGADVQTYLAAREEILGAEGALVPLKKSYRSTPALIEACNRILDQNANEPFFTGEIRYDHPVTSARPGFSARDASGAEVPPVVLFRPAPVAKVAAARLRTLLARRIAEEIHGILDPKNPVFVLSEGGPIAARDIFVLTRTKEEGYEVGRQFRRAGIPHVYFKQEGLFQTREANDIASLLKAIEEPQDRSRRFRAWLTPFFGVTLNELETLGDLPGNHPLMQRLFDWKALADAKDYARLFSRILEESGVVRRELFFKESERELTNYLHVFELLLEEAGRSNAALQDLIRSLCAYINEEVFPEGQEGNVQRLESERDAVQIMTIHKAKGLEASVVFLLGGWHRGGGDKVKTFHEGGIRFGYLDDDPPPSIKQAIKREIEEEDQRLLYVALTRARARLYLPLFRPGKPAIKGSYSPVAAALARLLSFNVDPRLQSLFEIRDYPYDAADPDTSHEPAPDATSWKPPEELLSTADWSAYFREMRQNHAGFFVTSYTGLKRGTGYEAPEEALQEEAAEPQGAEAEIPEARGEFPGGRASGILLHAVLEKVPLPSLAGAPPFSAWAADPKIREIFEESLQRFGRDRDSLEPAQRLVHTALTASVRLPGGRLLRGLSTASREIREMEFLYPIPEREHPRLSALLSGAAGLERFRIGRGFLGGFVDLLFEHEGLTYFLDWKSDSLPRWTADALETHVARNYALQAKLYALALVKMLGVHDAAGYEKRFGGFLYCFLRGMRSPGTGVEGIHARRPAWKEILAWEEELLRRDYGSPSEEAAG
jgi:exodeoxyribonuclease V beta subunit